MTTLLLKRGSTEEIVAKGGLEGEVVIDLTRLKLVTFDASGAPHDVVDVIVGPDHGFTGVQFNPQRLILRSRAKPVRELTND